MPKRIEHVLKICGIVWNFIVVCVSLTFRPRTLAWFVHSAKKGQALKNAWKFSNGPVSYFQFFVPCRRHPVAAWRDAKEPQSGARHWAVDVGQRWKISSRHCRRFGCCLVGRRGRKQVLGDAHDSVQHRKCGNIVRLRNRGSTVTFRVRCFARCETTGRDATARFRAHRKNGRKSCKVFGRFALRVKGSIPVFLLIFITHLRCFSAEFCHWWPWFRDGQLIWFAGRFEKAAFRGGPCTF